MDMIGTRNEKIALVLTAYVIGFTTAFIAFGVSDMSKSSDTANELAANNTQQVDYKHLHQNISDIGTDEFGLFVDVGGYRRTISASASLLEASVIKSATSGGYAVAHHQPSVSPDGWMAFYCEQVEAESTSCNPYVYNLYDDTVYKVTLDGIQEPLTVGAFTASWSVDNYLTINDFFSADNVKPWVFESVFDEEQAIIEDEVIEEETDIAAEEVTETTPDQFEESAPEVQ